VKLLVDWHFLLSSACKLKAIIFQQSLRADDRRKCQTTVLPGEFLIGDGDASDESTVAAETSMTPLLFVRCVIELSRVVTETRMLARMWSLALNTLAPFVHRSRFTNCRSRVWNRYLYLPLLSCKVGGCRFECSGGEYGAICISIYISL
jgi:hypothetical protein